MSLSISLMWKDDVLCGRPLVRGLLRQNYEQYRNSQCLVQSPEGQKKQPTTICRKPAHSSQMWIIREPQRQESL